MKSLLATIFVLCLLRPALSIYKINDTLTKPLYASDLAYLLKGNPSSHFPGPSMLNYLLYGTSEAGFYYYEFLQNYGIKSKNFNQGNLVIGNDGVLGGICYGDNHTVILPIQNSHIQEIPIANLNKYFPYGFTILNNYYSFDQNFLGSVYSTFAGSKFCQPCQMELQTFNNVELTSFLTGIYLNQTSLYDGKGINLYSYIQHYDYPTKKGIMLGCFYDENNNGSFSIGILDSNNNNSIPFVIDSYHDLSLNGNIHLKFNGKRGIYDLNAVFHLTA